MARRRQGRPKGAKRPPNRHSPRGGKGPGPTYRPSSTGGGTTHKSSSTARGPVAGIVFAVSAFAVLFVGTPVVYLIYQYAKGL